MSALAIRDKRDEAGFLSVEYMLAVSLSLLFLVMMTNIVVIQYGRGVVRAAADEGARAGALVVADPIQRCTERAGKLLSNIGGLGSSQVQCSLEGDQVLATTSATFDGWLPWMPSFAETTSAVSHKERAPA